MSAGRTSAPTRAELRRHLESSRIAGDVATPRENNLRNYARLARADPHALFGLRFDRSWGTDEVLAVMARRCGVAADPGYLTGPDRIDPDLTLAGLDAMADRLAAAAAAAGPVLVATGHPAGLLPVHQEIARRLAGAGCLLLRPAAGWSYSTRVREASVRREIRYIGGVAVLSNRGELNHTHSPQPMAAMLAELAAERGAGARWPALVVADHGWAGAAGQAGVEVVSFADSNDPALFVGREENKITVAVPLDDNVAPHLYAPLTAYLLARAGL